MPIGGSTQVSSAENSIDVEVEGMQFWIWQQGNQNPERGPWSLYENIPFLISTLSSHLGQGDWKFLGEIGEILIFYSDTNG